MSILKKLTLKLVERYLAKEDLAKLASAKLSSSDKLAFVKQFISQTYYGANAGGEHRREIENLGLHLTLTSYNVSSIDQLLMKRVLNNWDSTEVVNIVLKKYLSSYGLILSSDEYAQVTLILQNETNFIKRRAAVRKFLAERLPSDVTSDKLHLLAELLVTIS